MSSPVVYLDALSIDQEVRFHELVEWMGMGMTAGKINTRYLADVQIWEFTFDDARDAMLFKLTFGGR